MVSHFYPANLWKNLTEILHAATEAYIFWAMGIRTLSTFLLAILLKSQNSWFLETFPTTLWQSSRLFVALLNRRYFHQLKIIRKQQQHTHTHHTPDATFDFTGGREATSQGSLGAELYWLLRSLDTVLMATRNPASKNQWRASSWNPHYLQGLSTIQPVVGNRNSEPSTVHFGKNAGTLGAKWYYPSCLTFANGISEAISEFRHGNPGDPWLCLIPWPWW